MLNFPLLLDLVLCIISHFSTDSAVAMGNKTALISVVRSSESDDHLVEVKGKQHVSSGL